MNSHNNAKKLEELESMPFETLTKKQREELGFLQHMKEKFSELDEIGGNVVNYYDKKGNPISYWEYSGYSSDWEYKIIKHTTYGDFFVSTVWLGLDHSNRWLRKDCKILIFETMIFNDEKEHELGNYQERYTTENEARNGHIEACKLASEAAHKECHGVNPYKTLG